MDLRRSCRIACLLAALLALALPAAAGETSGFAWRQFEGVTLRVLLSDNHWQQVSQQYFPEFEQLTGIKLAVEMYTQAKLWDVLEQALVEPGRVDVFSTVPALDGPRYLRLGRVRPVNDLLRDPARTAPEFAWDDFLPRARAGMEVDGALLGPPLMGGHFGLLYRRDLFQAHQISVPRTLAELEAAARLLHRKPMDARGNPGAAVVTRGNGSAATSLFAGLLNAMGGRWFDEAGRPLLTSEPSLRSLEFIGRLLSGYAPPNVESFGWQEASSLFRQEGAAMYLEDSSIYPLIEEPVESRVAGKVGYALFPSGPAGSGTTFAVRGLAIAKQSASPGAAWLFCQWAAGPEMVRRGLQRRVLVARESTWQGVLPEKLPVDLALSFQEAGRIGATTWAPPMVAVTAGRQALGQAIEAAARGESVSRAADAANRRLLEVLAVTEPPATRPR